MAYDELLADRIRQLFSSKKIAFEEKKMMGGLAFMVDGKMCVGLNRDKDSGQDRLMARVGKERYEACLQMPHARKMEFTGREMKGFVWVDEDGIERDEELGYWLDKALAYNPEAKSSKR